MLEIAREVDAANSKIEVGNITELKNLANTGAAVVTGMLGVKNRKITGMEPW